MDLKIYKNVRLVFVVVLVIIVVGELIGVMFNILVDVVMFQNLENCLQFYGEQCLWGEVGWGVMVFIIGFIVQY